MASIAPPTDAVPIEVNGWQIKPQETYARDANNTDYIIVTAYGILSIEEESELDNLGVKILEDLGDNNFLCHYLPKDLTEIRKKKFVRQVDVYRNKFKIPAALQQSIQQVPVTTRIASSSSEPAEENPTFTVDILAHETVSEAEFEALTKFIVEKSGIPLDELEVAPGLVRLSVDADKLIEIAMDDRVRIIEEVLEPRLMSTDSNDTRGIVRGGDGIKKLEYSGKGQIITVTDTGFDLGSLDDCHPAFTGKVLNLTAIGRAKKTDLSDQKKTDDPHGHGTHVSGIILGNEFNTTKGWIGGIAPDAKLIMQSLFLDDLHPCSVPADLGTIVADPFQQGSRIFSNSWGVGFGRNGQPDYAEPAKVLDNFIRDHPDILVCFSAGNDNQMAKGKASIGLHAGAKNVLTIGATGNLDAPDQMYVKSSIGPTKEQRLKPDVVAPGVGIYAALSRRVARYFGAFATSDDQPNIKWKVDSGTSQATPLVAGCAAVLREVLQARGCSNPPGTLLKAVLINGADKLPGIDTSAQGYGRVNLQNSAAILDRPPALSESTSADASLSMTGGTLIGHALKQDGAYEFTLLPPDDRNSITHFKITMVYNDIGNKQIQNNLNLLVTDLSTNTVAVGNDKSLTDPDVQNNVEQVILSPLSPAGLRIRVHAQKILALQDQDFALAWSVFTPLPGTTS